MIRPQEYQRLLTPEQEIELARRVHGDDPADAVAARDELVLCNLGLVGKIVGRMANHWRHLEYDDLFSEALVALVQVAERYDPDTHHTRFSTYAVPDIRGRLRNFVSQKASRRAGSFLALDNQADPAPPALERIITDEEFGVAVTALGKLAPLKAYVIARRYGIGEPEVSTMREIARDIGCTYEYVRQLELKAISQLSLKTRV
jgi:RNA polymerase sigma factor (sigma-70 family)